MVGIVVVSHSAELAAGRRRARARDGRRGACALEEAGGLEDGSIGTDAERVRAAIERAMSDDGVLVLMDLGSALMSAEMAVELMEGDGRGGAERGAAGGGRGGRGGRGPRWRVARRGRGPRPSGALAMKAAQLGGG